MFQARKHFLQLAAAAALALPLTTAHAQAQAQAPAQPPLPHVEGEIRKIDAEAGKLTIRHAAIPNLDMPGMTMVFKATPEMIARAHAGEKILFTAERIDGALVVSSLQEKQ